jgi:two-component system, cell cycle sensor histidine kinase and response regulator CckA
MACSISLVLLEDAGASRDGITAALRAEGLVHEVTIVRSVEALGAALAQPQVEVGICGLSARTAEPARLIRTARDAAPQVSLIVVMLGDDPALEQTLFREGADEVIPRGRLGRLPWAIRRVLREREAAAQRQRLQQELDSLDLQLRHAQRLTNLARLAGGVAHDFNNLLTIINGCCQLLLNSLPPGHVFRPLVEPIEQAGARGAELTTRLLAFSRREPPATAMVSLNQVIREVQPMLTPLVGETVRLALNLEPSLWNVRADPGELSQVLMNLVTNARDAMPDGGIAGIRTANVDLFSGGSSPAAGSFVELVVRDSGCGMSEDVRMRIFEPFFTTKAAGEGTGLGLPTVRRIVAKCGGEIDVETAVGRGTTMRVRLPRAEGFETPAPPPPLEQPAPASGSGTVLLVEDEIGVRRVLGGFLRAGGYRVLEAGDADAASAICRKEAGAIDLLVSDVVLPGANGPSLAASLKQMIPGLRTLFISGYPAEAIAPSGLDKVPAFLAKPFSREALLQKVRSVLGAEAS